MDTVDKLLRKLEERRFEDLRRELVKILLNRKTFYKYRLLGKYYRVVIDGTHVMTVKEGHCEHCLKKTIKKSGKTIYFHNVLEAKLVCENGFCISLGTEWIENADKDYDKQDCEQKAFVRLAEKLKRDYPRLPICIEADGLYPNQKFFHICKKNNWSWIVTFKDGNLPSVWEEALCLKDMTPNNKRHEEINRKSKIIKRSYKWVNNIQYRGFGLNWFECREHIDNKKKRFVYISDLEIEYHNVLEMTESGRMRFKIENEGFNIQKNNGYNLSHRYSRVSMRATKNYYQCMQIAHMINQLFQLSNLFQEYLTKKMTVKHLWDCMLGELRNRLNIKRFEKLLKTRIQFRYD